jgi:hypothetical protein
MRVSNTMRKYLSIVSTHAVMNTVFRPRKRRKGARGEEVTEHQSKRKIGVVFELLLFFQQFNKLPKLVDDENSASYTPQCRHSKA